MKFFRKKVTLIIVAAISLSSVIFMSLDRNTEFKIVKNLDIFYSLFRELNLFYVDDTDPEKLVESAIDGMLSSLDPYTSYIPAKEKKNFKFQTTGEYGGIGSLIRKSDDYAIIAEPYKGFPADKSQLIAGDKIFEIDGTPVKNKSLKEISEMLKGMPNTSLTVKVIRPYVNDTLTVSLKREKITINSIPYYGMINDEIGYILLRKFTEDVSKELEDALSDLKKNYGAKKIILDLRNNSGGLLIEAINVSNVFIPKGELVVSTKGKIDQFNNEYYTENQPVDTSIPLVVLVNSHSASASEIVAGCFQDYDRAVIVGTRTFGKGLVQTTRPLSYDSQLKVTTAKYYIPSGRCIQAIDYAHKNEDGSVSHIPDSLISAFKTDNGRTVYDGGGIKPDVVVEADQVSKMAYSLYSKNLLFDYATYFYHKHDSIKNPHHFELTDSQYDSFVKFLKDKEFDYQTQSESHLNKLIKKAKAEKYYEIAEETFNELEKKLAHDKEKDLYTFKEGIIQLLEEEIVTRYYYQKGKIITQLEEDPQLNKAIEIFHENKIYSSILQGTYEKNDSTVNN